MPTTQLHPNALPGRRYGAFGGRAPTLSGVRTAQHEQIGNSVVASFDVDYRLRLPYGYGGARFYVLNPLGSGLKAILPLVAYCSEGGIPSATIVNAAAWPLDVVTRELAPVATLGPGAGASFRLLPNGGGWFVKPFASVAGGTTQTDRVPVEVRLTDSIPGGFNLRQRIIDMGFTDSHVAYGVRCTVAAGVVLGNEVATPAFNTGFWPGGSTLMLVLEAGAIISGVGGVGGSGADVPPGLLAQPGAPGGVAFRMYLPTSLVSAGTIQGGGGGGGGGLRNGSTPGAGGGGGAGYPGGVGGRSGLTAALQPWPGGKGFNGTIGYPGGGGYTPASSGAYGGLPGGGGSAQAAAGGAAGKAIEKPLGHVLTKIRPGIILGVEDP